MFADVRRGLTIAAAVEAATVTDTDGNVIDTTEFFGKRDQPARGRADEPRIRTRPTRRPRSRGRHEVTL